MHISNYDGGTGKMKIQRIDIKNFRKLENVKIILDDKTTLLVGANNSGKTSTIEALVKFLDKGSSKFVLYDWSISNWDKINNIGSYIENTEIYDSEKFNKKWMDLCPTLDLWFQVNEDELHHVIPLIPTLDWNGGMLGARFILEPNRLDELFSDYKQIVENNIKLKDGKEQINLWPNDFCHFLKRKLNQYFKMSYYTLDPKMYDDDSISINSDLEKLNLNPLKNLVKIDVINAQRGLNDASSERVESSSNKKLASELRSYYDEHLKPNDDLLEEGDLEFIKEAFKAERRFDEKLEGSFIKPINELRSLGYPGFTDPKIHISTKINYTDGLNHASAVQYSTTKNNTKHTRLPEDYTGLGYQNLIWMVFKLMSFRDEWLSNKNKKKLSTDKKVTPPLHLVVIEEPEAHLHTQVQQAFINKAYEVLINHKLIKKSNTFSTQLLVSTHSSYIIQELDFSNLRYFKRLECESCTKSPKSEIINLAEVFGNNLETTGFVKRYIKTTHCDIFFADAAILIEGSAERMLLPEFINRNELLSSAYLTILEIGGSHAFRLKPLIEKLGIYTLIISDLDPCKEQKNKKAKKVYPEKGKGYVTKNNTLIKWAPQKKVIDDLLSVTNESEQQVGNIFVTYQKEIKVKGHFSKSGNIIPSTFEDALILENTVFFKNTIQRTGPTKKIKATIDSSTGIKTLNRKIYNVFADRSFKKAEFSLDVLFAQDIKKLVAPSYISRGLKWLEDRLREWNRSISLDNFSGDKDE